MAIVNAARILLVEDDDVAAEAVVRGLTRAKLYMPITRVRNGREAVEILRQADLVTQPRIPFLVLLDLNLPVMNGFEFLDVLRADRRLAPTVVFALSTSDAEGDVARCYARQVAGYVVKADAGRRYEALAALLGWYTQVVTLP